MKAKALIRAICICMLASINIQKTEAQKVDSIGDKVHQLTEVTIKARRTPMKVTTTTPVQLLGKDEIKNLGLQNMADAVRRFAGTNVRDYGGIGGLKTVSVRNLGAAHTAVSYDGVVVSNTQAGQVDIGRFSLDNVSTLSLIIGHDDNLLQPARLFASAGVLNIETERPVFDGDKRNQTQIQLRGGSFGYFTPSLRHWYRLSNQTTLTANVNYLHADGGYPFTLKNGKLVTQEKRINSDMESWQGEVNMFHTFKDESELNAKAYYYHSERGLPGSIVLYNKESNERLWDEHFFVQARYKKLLSEKWKWQLQGKYNYSWNKYQDQGAQYTDGKQIDTNRQHEYYVSATWLYTPLPGWQIALAQDGIVNRLYTNGVNPPEPVRYTSLTALNMHYQWNRLKIAASLVATYISEKVKRGETPDDRKRLSPSFSLSWQPWKEHSLRLRAMYKQTFRVPTFSDLYYLRVGNTHLRPEKATEYTLGLTWSGSPFRFTDYLTLTLDGYYNTVNDKIVAFPSTYVWKMQNYGKARLAGIDLTMATYVPFGKQTGLSLSGNYSWQKAIDVTDKESKNYKHQLPYTPRHNGNVSALLETPWVNGGYTVTMVGKRYCLAQNIPENEIAGYAEHTATLWREFKLKDCNLRLQAEIINLTDEQYDVIKYYPMPGRSWRLTASIIF
ncbi:MAG: TonB-dependent receptor [Mediterranea massiliensis]|nr:TonB-dependent receptor [Mediterranea massiliensis]